MSWLIGSGKLSLDHLRITWESAPDMALAAALTLLALAIAPLRFHVLLLATNIRLHFVDVLRICFIGVFLNTFMLGGLGGDVVRFAYVARASGERAGTAASLMADRACGMLSVFFLGAVVLAMSYQDVLATESLHNIAVAVFGALVVVISCVAVSVVALARRRVWSGLIAWLLTVIGSGAGIYLITGGQLAAIWAGEAAEDVVRRRVVAVLLGNCVLTLLCLIIMPSCQPGRTIAEFLSNNVPLGAKAVHLIQTLLLYRRRLGPLAAALCISLVAQFLATLSIFMFSRALPLEAPPRVEHVFFAAPIAFLANTLPVPGGGLGVGEAAFDQVLSHCRTTGGSPVVGGASVFLLWRVWTIVLGLVGLPLYLMNKKIVARLETNLECGAGAEREAR